MKPIFRIASCAMLALALGTLAGCFDSGPYYGGGPRYAYAPEYVAPYRGGPVYYPPVTHPEPGYYVPGHGSVRYYNGGEHAWEHHEEHHEDQPPHEAVAAPEAHETHEAHDEHEHH